MANKGLLSSINYMLQYVLDSDRDMYSLPSRLCSKYGINYTHFTLSELVSYRKFLFKTNKKKNIGVGYITFVLNQNSNFKKFELVSENYYIATRDHLLANGHTINTLPEYMLTAKERRDIRAAMVDMSLGVSASDVQSVREFIS